MKLLWKSEHFPQRYIRKREWVFFSEHSVEILKPINGRHSYGPFDKNLFTYNIQKTQKPKKHSVGHFFKKNETFFLQLLFTCVQYGAVLCCKVMDLSEDNFFSLMGEDGEVRDDLKLTDNCVPNTPEAVRDMMKAAENSNERLMVGSA